MIHKDDSAFPKKGKGTKTKDYVVVLDLDGTIVDSNRYLFCAVTRLLDEFGYSDKLETIVEEITRGAEVADIMKLIDMPNSIKEAMTARLGGMVDIAQMKPFPGVADALANLKESGFKLAIATENRSDFTIGILELNSLTHFFDTSHIFAADNFSHRKPSRELMEEILKRAGRKYAIIVGDTIRDVRFAINCSTSLVLVDFSSSKPVEDRLWERYRSLKMDRNLYKGDNISVNVARARKWTEIPAIVRALVD